MSRSGARATHRSRVARSAISAVGIDGCRGGWVVVSVDRSGNRAFDVFPAIDGVIALRPAMAMIDMPIGLPESGDRGCDVMARAALGPHWPRVFTGARRPLLALRHDYATANRRAKSDGGGLSRQLFGILPKIAEVDVAMTPKRQQILRECHPELVFQRLNDGVPLDSKKTEAGQRRRMALVKARGFTEIGRWLGDLRGPAKADDVLDACACAIAATDALAGATQRFSCGMRDAKGLRMEIWF